MIAADDCAPVGRARTPAETEALTALFLDAAKRLGLPIGRRPAANDAAPKLVAMLEEIRDDLAWALEYADELAAFIAPAPRSDPAL